MSDIMEAVWKAGYQEGLEAVRKAGYQKGIEEGKAEVNRKVALKMIADGENNSAINHLTDLTDQEINDLRNSVKQMI